MAQIHGTSRIRAARQRASDAKAALAVTAAAAFVSAGLLAREHHPATAATSATPADVPVTDDSGYESSDDGYGFQPGSFSTSSAAAGAPSASTHAS